MNDTDIVQHNMRVVFIHDLINPQTGNTYKEDNLKRTHQIAIGILVEVKFDRWYGDGACMKAHARLWVVRHDRDCDGTPLYTISRWRDPEFGKSHDQFSGFPEYSLTPIDVTPRLRDGYDALTWDGEI